jgi:hypothetical protein
MKNIIKFSIIFLLISQIGKSQNMADAFRLSFNQINGTARAGAMGNAFGALGGDFTSLSINPAGIGIFLNNEFVISPSMDLYKSDLTVNQSVFSDNNYRLGLNNIGFVGKIGGGKNSVGKVSFNWGIGMNKVFDFNQVSFGENNDSPSSFLDGITDWANSEQLSNAYLNSDFNRVDYRDWPTKLAWDTYLLNPALDSQGKEIDGSYQNLLYLNEKVNQRKSFDQRGGINEMVIAGGFNFNHRFYIGATLGLQSVNINQITHYTEEFGGNSFMFTDNYSLTGNGVNFKLGVIYKPVDFVRLGFAVHTPTFFNALDQSNTLSMNAALLEDHTDEGTNLYNYDFNTPLKTVFSGALVIGKFGLVSLDVEALNYASMRFRNPDDDMTDLNSSIGNNFKSVVNIRAGGELKLSEQLSLRAGYENYGNPYNSSFSGFEPVLSKNSSVTSFGIGYNAGKLFADVTYRMMTTKYIVSEVQSNFDNLSLLNNNNKVLFTLGFRF